MVDYYSKVVSGTTASGMAGFCLYSFIYIYLFFLFFILRMFCVICLITGGTRLAEQMLWCYLLIKLRCLALACHLAVRPSGKCCMTAAVG